MPTYSNTMQQIVSSIESQTGVNAINSGKGIKVVCPIHGKKDRNLFLSDGDSRIVIHCHSHGCDPKNILECIGLKISDVYYEQLSPKERKKHAIAINARQIKGELEHELLFILFWLNDTYEDMFPCAKGDLERVKLAFDRAIRLLTHLDGEL